MEVQEEGGLSSSWGREGLALGGPLADTSLPLPVPLAWRLESRGDLEGQP